MRTPGLSCLPAITLPRARLSCLFHLSRSSRCRHLARLAGATSDAAVHRGGHPAWGTAATSRRTSAAERNYRITISSLLLPLPLGQTFFLLSLHAANMPSSPTPSRYLVIRETYFSNLWADDVARAARWRDAGWRGGRQTSLPADVSWRISAGAATGGKGVERALWFAAMVTVVFLFTIMNATMIPQAATAFSAALLPPSRLRRAGGVRGRDVDRQARKGGARANRWCACVFLLA